MDGWPILNCSNANGYGVAIAALWFCHSLFEWWLGKTEKTKASSSWELIFSVIMMLALIILRRFKNGSKS